jgi:hypothetical protein
MWAPKMSTKGQRGDQRTKDKGRTNLSSLSLFCVAHASIHSSSSRKKRRHRITRTKKARRILPPSRFSRYLRSRDGGGVVSSERESTQKKASIRQKGRQTNKRTKDGGTKNLKKVPTWHFSASKARQTFRGLASFVHKKVKGRREYETTLLLTR